MLGLVSSASPRVRMRRLIEPASGASLILGVLLLLAGCGGSSSTPSDTLQTFLSSWSRRDYAAMRAQVLHPPADFEAVNGAALSALGATSARFAAGRIRQSGSHATVRVRERFVLGDVGVWNTATTVQLTDHNGRWLVAWSSATINPALHDGDRFAVVSDWPNRAAILGAGRAPLTSERQLVTVGVVGSRIKNAHAVTADLLAAGASKSEIDPALAQAKAHPTYFDPVFQVTKARFEQLKNQPGPGNVYAVPGTQFELTGDRTALTAQLGAHVVGSVGPITAQELHQLGPPYDASSIVGQTGIEQAYERRLAGTPTTRVLVLNGAGASTATLKSFPGHPGKPVVTSIDPTVQRAAEAALAGVHHNAALVAIRPSNGDVLAVVSDPTSYGYDQALQGEYPPGSTFKVLTSTALIGAGLSPESSATCAPTLTVDGEVFHNAEGEAPVQTLAQAFTESCNTAFISLATAHLKPADFTAAARTFDLDATPQPGLPAFAAEIPKPTGETSLAATAIGQAGVVFSPLGMASVAAAVASGSVRAPRLVAGAPDDRVAPKPLPGDVTSDLRQMMGDVVASGTASGTGLPSTTHAKTGTAQYYAGGKLHTDAWLMGYDGDVAFAVLVQDSGGINGGPLDGPIAARFLNALGPP
jgi:cell division protein FtsI/penicillin-binding protein 2